jgi:hypothetical protein
MTKPGLGSGSATVAGSFHQFVELRLPRFHFGARHRVDDDAGRIPRPMAPLRGRREIYADFPRSGRAGFAVMSGADWRLTFVIRQGEICNLDLADYHR